MCPSRFHWLLFDARQRAIGFPEQMGMDVGEVDRDPSETWMGLLFVGPHVSGDA